MLLDDEDVRSLDLQALRRAISFVSQRITLSGHGRTSARSAGCHGRGSRVMGHGLRKQRPSSTPCRRAWRRRSKGTRRAVATATPPLLAPCSRTDRSSSWMRQISVDNETEAKTPTIDGAHPHGKDYHRIAHRFSTVDCRCHPRPPDGSCSPGRTMSHALTASTLASGPFKPVSDTGMMRPSFVTPYPWRRVPLTP